MKTGFPEDDVERLVWSLSRKGSELPDLYKKHLVGIGWRMKQFEGILKASMEKAGVAS